MEQKEKNRTREWGSGQQVEAFLRLITLTWYCAKDGGKVCAINA